MAPRRGGSSSSSSSGGCVGCSETLDLRGGAWRDPVMTALFAVTIICTVAMFACFALSLRFRWQKADGGHDKLRNTGYKVAAVLTILTLIISIINTILRQELTRRTYLYFIVYIVTALLTSISDVVLIAVILRIPCENPYTNRFQRFVKAHKVAIGVLALLSAGLFIIQTVSYALQIHYGSGAIYGRHGWNLVGLRVASAVIYLSIAYYAFYVLVSLLVIGEAVALLSNDRSKPAKIFAFVVGPLLLLRGVFLLAYYASIASPGVSLFNSFHYFTLAGLFIDPLALVGIFAGVVTIGYLLSRGNRGSRDLSGLL